MTPKAPSPKPPETIHAVAATTATMTPRALTTRNTDSLNST